jgi:WD40 repeat protein
LLLAVVGGGLYYLGSQRTLQGQAVQVQAVHRVTLGVQGPGNDVYALTFTADGSVAALAYFGAYDPQNQTYADGQIKLWDVATGKELATLRGHARGAGSLAFSPDGRLLASCGTVVPDAPVEVKLWDVTRAAEVATFLAHTSGFASLAFSPDGTVLAMGEAAAYDDQNRTFKDAAIRLWDVELRKERAVLKGYPGSVCALAFAPDGKTLASANRQKPGDIKLWDVTTATERATLTGHVGPVLCLAFSRDNRVLASGGEGPWSRGKGRPSSVPSGEVKLWDVGTGKERVALDGHPVGPVSRVAFTADGKGLASVGRTVKLWDATTGRERASFLPEGHSREKPVSWPNWCDVWSTADGLVLVSRDQYLVKLWDAPLKK